MHGLPTLWRILNAKSIAQDFVDTYPTVVPNIYRNGFFPEIVGAIRKGVDVRTDSLQSMYSFLENLCSHYLGRSPQWNTMQSQGKTSEDARLGNCEKVNERQCSYLHMLYDQMKTSQGDFPLIYRTQLRKGDMAIIDAKLSEKERHLVLCDRLRNGMDPLELTVAYIAAREYARRGYSKVFTGVKVIGGSKDKEEWARELYSSFMDFNEDYFPQRGRWFTILSGIGANPIHFMRSMPQQYFYGSIPIVGMSVLYDPAKDVPEFVPLALEYFSSRPRMNSNRGVEVQRMLKDKAHTFLGITDEVIRSIRELEDKMIADLEKPIVMPTLLRT